MKTVTIIFCTILVCSQALARSIPTNILEPTQGLYVENPGQPISGPTTSAANWRVQFYGAPAGTLLDGFSQHLDGSFETDSNGKEPAVQSNYYPASRVTRLYQSGRTLPCLIGGGAAEFDLQLAPDNILQYNSLSSLSHLYMQASLAAVGYAESDTRCALNVSVVTEAITLHDTAANQIFFYQIKLGSFGGYGEAQPAQPDNKWFFTGQNTTPGSGIAQQFGYDGSAADYGQATLKAATAETVKFDILRQISAIMIQGGQYGMDKNLANWVIVENYPQVSLFGHVSIAGYFQGVSILEQTK